MEKKNKSNYLKNDDDKNMNSRCSSNMGKM